MTKIRDHVTGGTIAPRLDRLEATLEGVVVTRATRSASSRSHPKYSVLSEHKQLFAAKYVTYLPSVEEFERDRRIAEAIVKTPRAVRPASRAKGRKK